MSEETSLAMTDESLKAKLAPFALKPDIVTSLQKIERLGTLYSVQNVAPLPEVLKALVLAKGLHEMRQALTLDLVKLCLMPLQGSKLGFRTDKDKDGGYPPEEVRDVAIEAMLKGLRFTGNEINIIGGNLYVTLEAYERKVGELVVGLQMTPHAPEMKNGGGLVGYEASWYQDGKRDELRCVLEKDAKTGEVVDKRIPVRVNAGQIVDAILGKARRKMLARIFERVAGGKLDDPDAIDTDGFTVQPAAIPVTDGKRMSLKRETAAEPTREPGQEG